MTSNIQPNLHGDAEDPNCDPRLKGWTPVRLPIGPLDCGKITITKLVERPPSSLFDRRDELFVYYTFEGNPRAKRTTFERQRDPGLGSLEALERHMRNKFEPYLWEELTLSVVPPNLLDTVQESEALRQLSYYRNFTQRLDSWNPSEDDSRRMKRFIRRQLDIAYTLGMLAREIELRAAFEADAEGARRSAVGSSLGAKKSAAKRTQHAKAWKSKFAVWLQPLIDSEVARRGGSISREKLADFVDANWKGEEFFGTYAKQATCPEPGSLMKILKELEKSGEIVRPSPPRGRKPSN